MVIVITTHEINYNFASTKLPDIIDTQLKKENTLTRAQTHAQSEREKNKKKTASKREP